MKTLVFIASLLFLASCDVYVVDPEPIYDPRDQFTGAFDLSEYSSTYDESWEYGVSINKTSRGPEVIIDNFYNSGLRVTGIVEGGHLNIPWQKIDGYEIQGNGFISGDKLTISYYVRDTFNDYPVKDFCDATGWRIY
jgi:hypothetical protein